MKSRRLAHDALTVALLGGSFLVFRGTTNVLNGWVVPLILYLHRSVHGPGRTWLPLFGLGLLSLFFFRFQLFFLLAYAAAAGVLTLMEYKSWSPVVGWLLLGAVNSAGYLLALVLTDELLGIPLRRVLGSMVPGLPGGWVVITVAQGMAVAAVLYASARWVRPRVEGLRRQSAAASR